MITGGQDGWSDSPPSGPIRTGPPRTLRREPPARAGVPDLHTSPGRVPERRPLLLPLRMVDHRCAMSQRQGDWRVWSPHPDGSVGCLPPRTRPDCGASATAPGSAPCPPSPPPPRPRTVCAPAVTSPPWWFSFLAREVAVESDGIRRRVGCRVLHDERACHYAPRSGTGTR